MRRDWSKIQQEYMNKEDMKWRMDNVVWEELIKEYSYYMMFSLKLFITAPESKKRIMAQKIVDYAYSLQKEYEGELHYAEFEKPKVHDGILTMSITNEMHSGE